ncbi:hypothetical protein [Streptomyces sp. LaPpAH-108]|uniref:hypothetical protein n=1 Tax=Streptomyces sp. LaPpAH-108 TaxID=1155714 RepID=UPI000375F44B|nr:hypothetical protein [Streptomyces sp. LaPpAH-108]
MSLPMTRRIARAALLTAAGVVAGVGVAGTAGAAAQHPSAAPGLGGLSALDGVSGLAGNKVVQQAVPAAGALKNAAPAASKATGTAGGVLGNLSKSGLPLG